MKLTDSFSLSEDVVARVVGEETMLLDLASGTYFGLNPVGGRFWQLLEDGLSATDARDALLEAFDVRVLRLVRVAIGPIELGTLAKGAWRLLDAHDLLGGL